MALTTVGAPLGSLPRRRRSPTASNASGAWWSSARPSRSAACFYGLTFNPILIVVFGFLVNLFERGYTALGLRLLPRAVRHPRPLAGHRRLLRTRPAVERRSARSIIAALYNGVGYQSVFYFIAGTWLFGAVVLAIFGPRTRPDRAPRPAELVAGEER